ncbi:protein CHROMOSOME TRANSMISSION FIDELITY 7 [Quillaja saponaria]|uniref:Protein CHROMOSOME TRANSMISSION FIDELITY 7 n=1 Tax=Quillaja saponaria TaxID=32244 RepID=A0AAD7LTL1_QUISA|nr:protein CHROMOSOME TRANSMISSION FIDELITY 7 [Quillaja saponaria]
MQPKISAFFKSSSVSASKSSDPPLSLEGDDDELTLWDKRQHQFFNTYKRRSVSTNGRENDEGSASQTVKKPEWMITGRALVKNKKRSYAQLHLDLGQSDFLLHTCFTCGVKYAPGDEEDEKMHQSFHKNYTHGIQFKGWSKERVVSLHNKERGRIILVLDSDPPAHRKKVEEVVQMMEIELGSHWIVHKLCKVYLFISFQRIVGCLVAEPIKEAFKVISSSVVVNSDVTKTKDARSRSAILQFGGISFQREFNKREPLVNGSDLLDGDLKGPISCENKAVDAVCGIRAIWVTPSNRRKHIANQLLDAIRKSFCMDFVLERSQIAFSQPTSAGKALASKYTGSGSFLVYKTDRMEFISN